jgi:hypothetical protein
MTYPTRDIRAKTPPPNPIYASGSTTAAPPPLASDGTAQRSKEGRTAMKLTMEKTFQTIVDPSPLCPAS